MEFVYRTTCLYKKSCSYLFSFFFKLERNFSPPGPANYREIFCGREQFLKIYTRYFHHFSAVCVCVCVCLCMYVCMYECMWVCMNVCGYVCMNVCMNVCMYVGYVLSCIVLLCMYVCMWVCIVLYCYACMCVMCGCLYVYLPIR